MNMNKRIIFIAFLAIMPNLQMLAQKLIFDGKYVTVGVLTNTWMFSNNPNIRMIGENSQLNGTETEASLNAQNIGKKVLDLLFERDNSGLHMEKLYQNALNNVILEDKEIAAIDYTAEEIDVLKKDVSRQLLKNNFVVLIETIKKGEKDKVKRYWKVYKVMIDDNIIEQAFLNWQSPRTYDQINVPVKFIAKGKVPSNINNLTFKIAKKVPEFAIRGSLKSRHPFLANVTSKQGVKRGDRFFLYRFKEKKNGEQYSKKVCTARVTEVTNEETRLHSISGKFASRKNGDIAVLRDRAKSSVTLLGQYSGGNDSRIGGRLSYDYLLKFAKPGIAQYLLFSVEHNQFKKEPEGVWWSSEKGSKPVNVRGTVTTSSICLGYGIGFNILGRVELYPYLLGGYQNINPSGLEGSSIWNYESQSWKKAEGMAGAFVAYGGIKVNMNVWYPLQFTIGADYNYTFAAGPMKIILDQHKINRVNLYAGFRLHF